MKSKSNCLILSFIKIHATVYNSPISSTEHWETIFSINHSGMPIELLNYYALKVLLVRTKRATITDTLMIGKILTNKRHKTAYRSFFLFFDNSVVGVRGFKPVCLCLETLVDANQLHYKGSCP